MVSGSLRATDSLLATKGYLSNSLKITSTDLNAHLIFSRSNYNYISIPSGSRLAICANEQPYVAHSGVVIEVNTDANGLTSGTMLPGKTNVMTLGSYGNKWSATHTSNIYLGKIGFINTANNSTTENAAIAYDTNSSCLGFRIGAAANAATTMKLSATAFYHGEDGTGTLGTNTYRWQKLYLKATSASSGSIFFLHTPENQTAHQTDGFIGGGSNGAIGIYATAKIVLRPATNDNTVGVELTSSALYPTTTDTMNLGISAKKWNNVHANILNVGAQGTTTAPSALSDPSDRIIITPYYYTESTWKIASRDDETRAYLSLYCGSTELIRLTPDGWICMQNNHGGFHWPNCNGAYLYANNISTYGALVTHGTKGTYCGIHLGPSTSYMTVMSTDTHQGLYTETKGWIVYYSRASTNMCLRTSTQWGYSVNIDGTAYASMGFYNAVWNDYAEYRVSMVDEPGRVVIPSPTGNGVAILASQRLQAGARIVSDTFGMAVGISDEAKTPIGISGRVLAFPYRPISEYHIGDVVCSAPNGTIDIMSREEIKEYPECILGIVHEIPTYSVWKNSLTGIASSNIDEPETTTHSVEVNGRIWIDIK